MHKLQFSKIDAALLENYNLERNCSDKTNFCHAPQKSLYFGRNGYISACCYNRFDSYGRYPDLSVMEIWQSAVAQSIRQEMANAALPRGCALCVEQLKAQNFKNLLASNFDRFSGTSASYFAKKLFLKRKRPHFPEVMEFELSSTCNLECTMCNGFFSSSIRKNREKLPALPEFYDSAFVKQLLPFIPHLREARFLGGEPFLIDIYLEIWEAFARLNPGCKISITTNGSVLSNRVKKIIEKLNCQIIVSIDSLEKDNYEAIRKNASFERAMDNISYFEQVNRRNKNILGFAVSPMVNNWHELPNFVNYANSRSILLYFNTVVSPQHLSLKHLTYSQLTEVCQKLTRARADIQPYNGFIARSNLKAFDDICNQFLAWLAERANSTEEIMARLVKEYLHQNQSTTNLFIAALANIYSDPRFPAHLIKNELYKLNGSDQRLSEYFEALWFINEIFIKNGISLGNTFNQAYLNSFQDALLNNLSDAEKIELCHILQTNHPTDVNNLFKNRTVAEALNEMRKYTLVNNTSVA